MKALTLVLTMAVLATGCRERGDAREDVEVRKPTDEPVTSRPGPTAGEHDVDFERARKRYESHARDRLARIDARIRELAESGEAKSEAAAEELREDRDRVAEELEHVGDVARPAWDRFQDRVSRGFDAIERRLDEVTRE